MKQGWLIISCCLWYTSINAQIEHITLGLERNLPSKSVYGICEDDLGRIWIGTDNGVAYFQNGTFHRVNNDSLPSLVTRVFPANDSGIILVGNNPKGIWKVHKNGDSKRIDDGQKRNFPGYFIAYSKQKEAIYYSDWKYLVEVSKLGIDTLTDVNGNKIAAVGITSTGLPYITNNENIVVVTPEGCDTVVAVASNTSAYSEEGKMVTISDTELNFFSKNVPEKTISWSHNKPLSPMHAIVHNNDLWFTGALLGLFKYSDGRVTDVSRLLNMPLTQFTYVFVDQRNNVWCSTNGDGIVLLPSYEYIKNYTDIDGLSDNFVKTINHNGDGSSYVVTHSGIHLFDGNGNIEILSPKYKGPPTPLREVAWVNNVGEYPLLGVTTKELDRRTLPRMASHGLAINGYHSLVEGNRLVYGGGGIFQEVLIDYSSSPPGFSAINDAKCSFGRITSILKVDSGYIFSADGGIFFYNSKTQSLSKEKSSKEPEGYFAGIARNSKNELFSISRHNFYQRNDSLWDDKFNFDSLQSGILTGIAIDAFDNVWIGTENGLIHISEGDVTKITTLNGLLNNDISYISYNQEGKTLWIAAQGGLSVLDVTHKGIGTPYNKRVRIKHLNIIKGPKYAATDALELKSYENNFTIKYSIDEYFELGFPEYRYRLVETGGEWKYTHESDAEFLALSPGEYTFEIGVRIPGNYWSSTEQFHFSIKLPFWKTWEFYTIISLSLMLVISLAFLIRLRIIRATDQRKRQTLIKMNQLELQALNANMNPHFIFNSLNSVQHYLLPLKNIQAINYVTNLSRLIRLNMQAVGKKLVHLEGEIQRTELYIKLEQERFDKVLNYELDIDIEISKKSIWLPSMIIQPSVENAIWHGIMPSSKEGFIKISMHLDGEFLFVSVIDNGVGFKAKTTKEGTEHESMGTMLTAERLKLLHPDNNHYIAEILDEDGHCQGTRVDIKIWVSLS